MFMSETVSARPPDDQAFVLPPHRIREAREVAAGARWFEGCPDARCRARRDCIGKLRRIADGPRCYPGCLAFALGTLLDPAPAPAARAALRGLLAPDGAFEIGGEDDATPPEALLTLLLHLAADSGPAALRDRQGLSRPPLSAAPACPPGAPPGRIPPR